MKKILFIMFGAISHINPTIVLARKMQERGYDVIYSIPRSLEDYIRRLGFKYHVQVPYFVASPLHYHIHSAQHLIDFKAEYLGGTVFKSVLDTVKPDLIILDTAFVNSSIELRKTKIPVFIAQLWCSIKKKDNVPPINSYFIPTETTYSRMKSEWLWLSYFFKRRLDRIKRRLFRKAKMNEFKLLGLKLRAEGLSDSIINFKSYFHIGVNCFPEVIFPPKEFDFPQAQTENEIYLGYRIDEKRTGAARHEEYETLKDNIFQKPTFYCSSGSMFSRRRSFIEKLCMILKDRQDVNLLLHVGSTAISLDHIVIPPNVFVFHGLLPQLEILKHAKLMLTHGGMNTVMECITHEVPMIVFPEALTLDQIGNAARVHHHKIGLSASVDDSAETIAQKISVIETNSSYRQNIKALKRKIYEHDGYEAFLRQIDSAFNVLPSEEKKSQPEKSYD